MTGYQTVSPPLNLPIFLHACVWWQWLHGSMMLWFPWSTHPNTSGCDLDVLKPPNCVNKLTKCALFHKMLHCTCTAESWRQLSGYGGQGQPQMSSLLGFAQQYAKDQLAELGHRINQFDHSTGEGSPMPPMSTSAKKQKGPQAKLLTCSHYLERCCSAAKLLEWHRCTIARLRSLLQQRCEKCTAAVCVTDAIDTASWVRNYSFKYAREVLKGQPRLLWNRCVTHSTDLLTHPPNRV